MRKPLLGCRISALLAVLTFVGLDPTPLRADEPVEFRGKMSNGQDIRISIDFKDGNMAVIGGMIGGETDEAWLDIVRLPYSGTFGFDGLKIVAQDHRRGTTRATGSFDVVPTFDAKSVAGKVTIEFGTNTGPGIFPAFDFIAQRTQGAGRGEGLRPSRMTVVRTFDGALPPVDATMIAWSTHVAITWVPATTTWVAGGAWFNDSNIRPVLTGIFWQPCVKVDAPGLPGGQITFLVDGRLDQVMQFPATALVSIEAEALIKWRGEGPIELPVIDRPDLTFRDVDRGYYATAGTPGSTQVHPALFFLPAPPLAVDLFGTGVHMFGPGGAVVPEQIPTFLLTQLPAQGGNPDPMPVNVFTTEHTPTDLTNPAVWPTVASAISSGWHQLFASQGPDLKPPRLFADIRIRFSVGPTGSGAPGGGGGPRGGAGAGTGGGVARNQAFQSGLELLNANRIPESAAALEALLGQFPGDAEIIRMWGLASMSCNRNVPAVRRAADALVAANPNDPQALLLLGQAALFTGDESTAVRALSAARAASPSLMEAVYNEAFRLLGSGIPAVAYVQYKSLVWMQPADWRAFYGLGFAAKALGRREEAVEAFGRYLQYDSTSEFAERARAELR